MMHRRDTIIKRVLAAAAAVLFLFGGCAVQPERAGDSGLPSAKTSPSQTARTPFAASPGAFQTPAPSAAPVSVLLLADCAEKDILAYAEAVRQLAAQKQWLLTEQYCPAGALTVPAGAFRGMLVLLKREDTPLDAVPKAISGGTSCAVLDFYSRTPPAGAAYLRFPSENAPGFALTEALKYPPHDTPVRLIALLEKKNSPADKAFRAAIQTGKVLQKGMFYANGKPERAADYVEARLKKQVAGTVDAIYAENTAMASQALRKLHALNRTDMEVFAVPKGFVSEQTPLLERFLFPEALGADPSGAADRQAAMLTALMNGGAPQNDLLELKSVSWQSG